MRPPVETTAALGGRVAAGTHGIRVGERTIFIDGEGLFETEHFRELAAWEIQQFTHVFPNLFADMELAYEKEHGGRA